MRHRVYGKHLGRNKDERDNLFKGLVRALLTHGTIRTSETKAKAIKGLVDKVINLAKEKNREGKLQSYLSDKSLGDRLIQEIVSKLGTRTSGYTQIVKLGTRVGDRTMMVKMSLIGAEKLKPIEKELRIENRHGLFSRRLKNKGSRKALEKPKKDIRRQVSQPSAKSRASLKRKTVQGRSKKA